MLDSGDPGTGKEREAEFPELLVAGLQVITQLSRWFKPCRRTDVHSNQTTSVRSLDLLLNTLTAVWKTALLGIGFDPT